MVELELLVIAWLCQKTAAFTEGIEFTIVTEQNPLISILSNYSLAEIENKRLQRLWLYKVEWIKGTDNKEAEQQLRMKSTSRTMNFLQLSLFQTWTWKSTWSLERSLTSSSTRTLTFQPCSDPILKQVLKA